MTYTFDLSELRSRIKKVQESIQNHDLDALLVHEPENLTYLTDYNNAYYNTSFQFVVILPDGDPIIVARHTERYWVESQSPFNKHVIYWYDTESPVEATLRVLKKLKLQNAKIGIEGKSWRASYAYVNEIRTEIPNIVDVGNLVTVKRYIKSNKEISLMRKAGIIAEKMMEKGLEVIRPGVSEREIAAALTCTEILEGSDYTLPGPISSGEAAKHIHATFSNRKIENQDLVFLEVTPHVRNYHARFMRTINVGEIDRRFNDLTKHLTEVQNNALKTVRAGVSCQVPDRIYREGILSTGAVENYWNKTFYSVGLMMDPNTYEPLEVISNSDFVFESGMTFHTYLVVDGFSLSETILVTETGYERLTNFKRGLLEPKSMVQY